MSETDQGEPGAKQTDEQIIAEAKARFTRCQDWESQARDHALADTKFAQGDAYNNWQWPDEVRQGRGDRPCLTNNKVRQHNLHIVNDARQHKAQIKVTPTGGDATYEAAEVLSGIVRRIEYQSKAIDAYSTAIFHQVESGIGYVRVVTDYADEDSFDQDIFIRRVPDPRTVYMDPDAQEYDKGDSRFAFVYDRLPRKEAKATYPDAVDDAPALDFDETGWDTKEHVRIAEYWRRGDKSDKLHLLADGSTVRDSALPKGAKPQIVKSRDVAEPEIEWFKIVGNTIVERKVWPGRYIPIIPFIGEETVIDGVLDRKGHTRCLLDAQRMVNYWESAAVEQVALQGKSPYVTPLRAIEGLETFWNSANTENHPYLPYNDRDPDTGQELREPTRAEPPQMAQAYLAGLKIAQENMMLVSGQYQAEMGAPGNEKSGVAIEQRQREGETATYHYIDNQAKGIRQCGRVVVDLIPKVYDVARVVKIMAEDGTQSDVHLEPDAPFAHQHFMPPPAPGQPPQPVSPEQAQSAQEDPNQPDPKVIFNPNVGRYDVEADVGPSFGTQRQEAFNALSQIIQASPDLVHVAGDLLFKSADFPLADVLAERLKRGVPQQFLGGPTPDMLKLQQQLQATNQHAQQVIGQADQEVAELKRQIADLQSQAKDKSGQTTIADYKAETDRLATVATADPAAAKILIRSMLSEMLGMPALPVMHAHDAADAAHLQEIMPPEPAEAAPAAS